MTKQKPIQMAYKRIKQDKKHPGVLLEMNKGEAIWDIAILVKKKVITMDDLEGFSEDLIEAVKLILSRWWNETEKCSDCC